MGLGPNPTISSCGVSSPTAEGQKWWWGALQGSDAKAGAPPTPQSKSRSACSEGQRQAQLLLGLNPPGGGSQHPRSAHIPTCSYWEQGFASQLLLPVILLCLSCARVGWGRCHALPYEEGSAASMPCSFSPQRGTSCCGERTAAGFLCSPVSAFTLNWRMLLPVASLTPTTGVCLPRLVSTPAPRTLYV